MKRKDWFSIAAFLVIYVISLIGFQFVSGGSWGIALITISLCAILVIVFYLFSIFARNRKGNYMGLWKKLGIVSFIFSVLFHLAFLSHPFMHFFNVIGNQDKIGEYVNMIIVDTDKMFDSYKKAVIPRAGSYDTQLKTSIKLKEYYDPSSIISQAFPMQKSWDLNFASKTSEQWKMNVMLKNWMPNKDDWGNKSKEYKNGLIDNFNIFTAANYLSNMIKQYDQYKDVLSKDFQNLTPYEKEGVYKDELPIFQFDNKENTWSVVQDIFTEMNFSFFPFLLFALLSVFMLFSFVFIKDENIKSPHKNKNVSSVYESGIKL